MTKIVNLFGGPGIGKSTLAAELFYILKIKGVSVELSREYVKDWAWENRKIGEYDQIYITAQQIKRESMLYGKVDYIISEAPLPLCAFYEYHYKNIDICSNLVKNFINYVKNVTYLNYILPRNKPYIQSGRYESEYQAKIVDDKLLDYLDKYKYTYERLNVTDIPLSAQILEQL